MEQCNPAEKAAAAAVKKQLLEKSMANATKIALLNVEQF
jgi:hypothetical protein